MVQCHKSVIVICSNQSKTRQNQSTTTLFYFRSRRYSPLRLFASPEISRASPEDCALAWAVALPSSSYVRRKECLFRSLLRLRRRLDPHRSVLENLTFRLSSGQLKARPLPRLRPASCESSGRRVRAPNPFHSLHCQSEGPAHFQSTRNKLVPHHRALAHRDSQVPLYPQSGLRIGTPPRP